MKPTTPLATPPAARLAAWHDRIRERITHAAASARVALNSPTALARWLPLAVILLGGLALRLVLLARDVPTLNSDEAVVGLMGLHALHGDFYVFYWGQEYMGSLEAWFVAPFLALFGASAFTLRLATLGLSLAFVATTYRLGALLYSRSVGLASAALLAIGPPFFTIVGLRAWGGYIETLVFGDILLLLALASIGCPQSRRPVDAPLDGGSTDELEGSATATTSGSWMTRIGRVWRDQAGRGTLLFGFLVGLALYTNALVAPFVLVVVVIFVWQRRRDLLARGSLARLFGGALVGALPAVIFNIHSGGGTIIQVLRPTLLGPGGTPTILLIPRNLWLLLVGTLPILAGADYGGLQGATYTPAEYAAASAQHPLIYAVNLLIALVALALLGWAAVSLVRGRRNLRAPLARDEGQPLDSERVRRQGEAALVLVGVCYLAVFTLTKDPDLFVMPRYALPLFAVVPLLVGRGSQVIASVSRWLGQRVAFVAARPSVALYASGLTLALLLGWNLFGTLSVTPRETATPDHGILVYGRDDALVALLRAHHVHTVLSNDYWEGFKLAFESGEQVIVPMVKPDGHPGFNRYKPYLTEGLKDPRPAYLELIGTPEAQADLDRLRAGQLPGYTAYHVGEFSLLVPG